MATDSIELVLAILEHLKLHQYNKAATALQKELHQKYGSDKIQGKVGKLALVPDEDANPVSDDSSTSIVKVTTKKKVAIDTPHQRTKSITPHLGKFSLTWERGLSNNIHATIADRWAKGSYEPFMIALVGIPGSGKSVSSFLLSRELEDLGCIVMPHDGYHYSMKELQNDFDNPADAIYRRGAPDTFDVAALSRDLNRIRNSDEPVVSVPGFEHAHGDPQPDQHRFVRRQHKVVICEGLYLLHSRDGWEHIRDYFDYSIFVEASVDVCMDRLKERNKVVPGYTPEQILIRVDAVDRVNSITVNESKDRADLTVRSSAM